MLKLDELLKKIEDSKNKEGQDTYAVFLDKNADLQIAKISISPVSVHIKTRNEAGQETGYTNIAVNTDCRFFADTIYCYDDFRKRGIAARLNELMDFTLRNYSGFVIRGSYDPKQLSTDREMNIYRSPEDLERSAHAYYKSAGYKIVSCKEFAKNPDKFPYLNYLLDFMGEKSAPGTEVIVVKQIKPRDNWPFVLVNGLLVREGVLEEKYFEDALKKDRLKKLEEFRPDNILDQQLLRKTTNLEKYSSEKDVLGLKTEVLEGLGITKTDLLDEEELEL